MANHTVEEKDSAGLSRKPIVEDVVENSANSKDMDAELTTEFYGKILALIVSRPI